MRTQETIWAANFYPGRILDIDLIVIHCTQSGTLDGKSQGSAIGVGRYFARPSTPGSTQMVHDNLTDVRCVRDEDTCWGARGHNANGLHFEFCGQADWSRKQWMDNYSATIRAGAVKIAEAMVREKIPFVYPAPVVNGRARNGIRTHHGLPGNDHSDPMPGPTGRGAFPIDFLLAEIKKNLTMLHGLKTSKPVMRARTAAEKKKREVIRVQLFRPDGSRMDLKGWSAASGALAWLADKTNQMNSETRIVITWQSNIFDSSVNGQYSTRSVANSIYTRFA